MAFTDFEATDWTLGDQITAALMDELEKRAMGARASCKVYRANNVTGVADTVYLVDWGAEEWDNDSMWAATGGVDSAVTINQAGIYLINATVATTGSATGNNTYFSIELNNDTGAFGDGTVLGFYNGTQDNVTPASVYNQVTAVANLSATDEIELLVMADATWGIDANVYGDAGDGCWMSVTMIGRTPTAS